MGISGLVRGVRAKMSAAAPLAASLFRPAAGAAPRRRRWIVLVGFLVAATAAFSALTQTPIIIANTAAAALFGVFDESDAEQDSRPPNICAPIPEATPTPTAAPGDTNTPATTAAPDALGPDGKPTPAAMDVIKQIPVGGDVDAATAWILFRLAHPHDTRVADYKAFDDAYASTRAAMSAQATPLDVVATMDPGANYSPYLLLAQAASYRLLRQGTLTATDQQTHDLITGLATSCAGHEHAHELS